MRKGAKKALTAVIKGTKQVLTVAIQGAKKTPTIVIKGPTRVARFGTKAADPPHKRNLSK